MFGAYERTKYSFMHRGDCMSQKSINILRVALLAVAVIFILVGWLRDEAEIVFIKAVNICLECIGIG